MCMCVTVTETHIYRSLLVVEEEFCFKIKEHQQGSERDRGLKSSFCSLYLSLTLLMKMLSFSLLFCFVVFCFFFPRRLQVRSRLLVPIIIYIL